MSTASKISRRTVAWSVPAITIAAAAPAAVASPVSNVVVTVTSSVKNTQDMTVTINLSVTNADGDTMTVTAISGGGVGANTWSLPVSATISNGGVVQIVERNNNASGTYTATYQIKDSSGAVVSSGTFTFTV